MEGQSTKCAPRGRSRAPIPPCPNPLRGSSLREASRATRHRRQSQIVMLPQGLPDKPKPLPAWKGGYFGFKHKINSNIFIPLLILSSVCGVGIHTVGLGGVSDGYFSWSISCEGIVTITEERRSANGEQIYWLGWARYNGQGPSITTDIAVITNSSTTNTSILTSMDGVAGSSIPVSSWLHEVDAPSAALGALTVTGHCLGLMFNVFLITVLYQLARRQFRNKENIFQPNARYAVFLLLWLVALGGLGFYLAVRQSFTAAIISTLEDEGFLCEDNVSITGEFAYVATGFACIASLLESWLMLWYGKVADRALADRFLRRALLSTKNTVTEHRACQ